VCIERRTILPSRRVQTWKKRFHTSASVPPPPAIADEVDHPPLVGIDHLFDLDAVSLECFPILHELTSGLTRLVVEGRLTEDDVDGPGARLPP
jgi:hypothetical protein